MVLLSVGLVLFSSTKKCYSGHLTERPSPANRRGLIKPAAAASVKQNENGRGIGRVSRRRNEFIKALNPDLKNWCIKLLAL